MQYLDHTPIAKQIAQWREIVQGAGVDEMAVFVGEGDLDESQLRIIGPLPDELGIERDCVGFSGAIDEFYELFFGRNHNALFYSILFTILQEKTHRSHP